MKNKLMFISLSVMTAGSSVQAKLQSVPVMLQHAVRTNGEVFLNQTSKALIPLFTAAPGSAQVRANAQAKIAQAAAGSTNPYVITEVFPRSVPVPGRAVTYYGKIYGWKTAFAKTFAPIAGLFGAVTADCMSSSASVAEKVTTPNIAEKVKTLDIVAETLDIVAEKVTTPDIVAETIAQNVLPKQSTAPVVLSFADKARALAAVTGSNLKTFGSSVKANSWDRNLGYFKHDGKVATTAAVVAAAGVTCAIYKAYQNGFFSKLNPFGKSAEVQAPVVEKVAIETTPVKVKAPVVITKRQFNKPVRWNAKTRTYEVAQ